VAGSQQRNSELRVPPTTTTSSTGDSNDDGGSPPMQARAAWPTNHGSGRQLANAAPSCVRHQLLPPCCKPVISGMTIQNILITMTTSTTLVLPTTGGTPPTQTLAA